jgi:hypothetical protein
MGTFATEHEAAIVDRLARWLAVGAIALGLCNLLQMAMLVVANGPGIFNFDFPDDRFVQVTYGISMVLGMGASALLLVGGVALWRRKP